MFWHPSSLSFFIIPVDYLLGKASGPDSGVVAKMVKDLDLADDIALLEYDNINITGPVPAHQNC